MSVVTAKTFPLGTDGKFQSEPAEFAYSYVAERMHLSREDLRQILMAFVAKSDECNGQRESWVEAGRPR